MKREVNIQVNRTALEAVGGLLAIVGVFAVGLWGGRWVLQGRGEVAPPEAAGNASLRTSGMMTVIPPAQYTPPPTLAPGQLPVSPEDTAVADDAPRIWLPEIDAGDGVYSFGNVAHDAAAEREIVIENVGEGTLTIDSVTASCGCTAAVLEATTVEPGGSTRVKVTYDPRVNAESGQVVRKQVRIASNDPLVPVAEFQILADVAAVQDKKN